MQLVHKTLHCNVVFQATTVENTDFQETVSHVSTLNTYKLKRNSIFKLVHNAKLFFNFHTFSLWKNLC